MRQKTKKTDKSLIIAVSRKDTCKTQRHDVFDAYHDSSYIKSHDRRKIVALTEKGENRVYRLINDLNHELVVMKVDGGIFNDSSNQKCDYAIYTQERILILIEIKGSDYSHAIDQLDTTINEMILSRQLNLNKLHTRVVLSKARIPNILLTKERILKRKLIKYNGSHEKSTRLFEERLLNL